ncbi:glycoside hydrolase family 99-like domain-containing protein [Mesorhizobium sp. B263B2A]|uniref:glycoside hydrolase family 99-like domain-containing protein n=1 Tax=Mesorhizobium sp. B263B2A TaxID=2876669 RepID=UPI001CD17035|nr:glycoside hydrolase family 99-like domain-containing protein [Mesorhizobium sp. B263B2A]MCA0029726.1 glycoside hydrolase family 99-like domain-containing protein [Mesorhizobium sp. B263B2A]
MNKHPSAENLQDAAPVGEPKTRKAKPKAAKRTCIMVLGMHRSGTSALTRAISLLGAELPKNLLGANSSNPTGHWEPERLIALHDQMLAEAGSSWDDWRAFDSNDLGSPRLRFYKAEIARLIDEEYGSAPLFVLKEPRISRFVPLYAEILKRMRIDVRYVLIERNPLAVIASLANRNGFTMNFSSLLWLRHELEAERATRGRPRVVLSYESLLDDWRYSIDRITDAFGLSWPRPEGEWQFLLSKHFSTDNQHFTASTELLDADPRIIDWIKDAYAALTMLRSDDVDAGAMAELDRIKAEFDSVAKIFGDAFFPELDSRLRVLHQQKLEQQQLAKQRNDEIERSAPEHAHKVSEGQAETARLKAELAEQQHLLEESASLAGEIKRSQDLIADLNRQIQAFQAERLTLEIQLKDEPPSPSIGIGVHSPTFTALSKIPEDQEEIDISVDETKLVAFYLPQFHRIDENSEWWGPGFTEWTNVARATPNFHGHNQPRIPRELGYYDLTHPQIMREQIEMAKLYGLHGFCFYHYWFSGKRVLEKPVDLFINSDIDFKFCLCWANENWTRAWDGDTKNILLEQKYAEEDAEAFIHTMLGYFNDQRYIKIGGMPLLVVYRAKDIPDPRRWFSLWRDRVVADGFPGLHISVVDFYDISTPDEVGADSLVEFPPHKFNGPQNHPSEFPTFTNPNFSGGIVDYRKMIAQSANRPKPSFNMFRGIIPGWDNTARRQNNPTVVVNSTPELYGGWLRFLRFQARQDHPDPESRLVFINAWNEWGEGCYLEPDQRWGLSYLEETLRSKFFDAAKEPVGTNGARARLFDRLVAPTENVELPGAQIPIETLAAIVPPSPIAVKASKLLRRVPPLHFMASYFYKRLRLAK